MTGDRKNQIGRRAVLTGGMALWAGTVLANAPAVALRPLARPLAEQRGTGGPDRPQDRLVARASLDDLIADAGLGGITGVVVTDLDTGLVLEGRDADADLMPASVTKVATALYALDTLGSTHRFETQIWATGDVVNGQIQGDLILVGGGDPVLNTDDLNAMVTTLTQAGITGVTGALRVWPGATSELRQIDPGQLPHLGYNPAVSGLNLNFNRVHFEWARAGGSYTVTMDARTETLRPTVRTARMRVADRSRPIYDYTDEGGIDAWSVAGSALGDGGSRWLPVRNPALYAGDVMRALAADQGLVLPAPTLLDAPPLGTILARHQSPALEAIIRDMLRFSTNLTAEVLGRAATRARGASDATLQRSAAAMSAWIAARYGVRTRFVDHSGLGDASRISAAAMTRILAAGQTGPLRRVLRTIPLVDDARDLVVNPPGVVLAKTGTLNFVSALAGYLTLTNGRRLAFTIFSADTLRRDAGKLSGDEQPTGSITFNTQAKRMQHRMLRRWGRIYGT